MYSCVPGQLPPNACVLMPTICAPGRSSEKMRHSDRRHGTHSHGSDVQGWGYADGNSGLTGCSKLFWDAARAYIDSNRGGK